MSTRLRLSPSLKPLLRHLLQDAMSAIQECQKQYATEEKTHLSRIYDTIGFLAAFTVRLQSIPSDMRRFLADEHWIGKPHEPKAKNIVRLATMYVLGAKESRGALYQQALTYSKVVDHFLAIGTDPVEIPALLKQQTIYGLLEKINPSRDHEEPAAAGEPGERQAQAKGAKTDDVVYSSLRDDRVEPLEDDDEVIGAAADDEAEMADPDPAVVEAGTPASTTLNEEDDDLFDGVPDPKQERREWEKSLIKRARAAWSEGGDVVLVAMAKQPFANLVQLRGSGRVALMCDYEYQPAEDWLALQAMQIKPL